MSKKNKPDQFGFVFSTNPDFQFEGDSQEAAATLPNEQQPLKVKLDTKHRGGKAVTLVTGFVGTPEDLETFGKQMKNFCGTGGAVKDGEAMVQGDQREKVMQFLQKQGYKKAKRI
ncbi:translation initiation factor [Gynurincola endophyticus]|jgi:translation initiation factor 1|uniref:translation initiation factor n=1 Tax=Gynurincola endophyticus TaxID=2479004 RepID=UPI000F8E84F0|nr:translation initiation factor [Gynurincola endophyticus]